MRGKGSGQEEGNLVFFLKKEKNEMWMNAQALKFNIMEISKLSESKQSN